MQDPEGTDRVAKTNIRIDVALARHIEEHDERARKVSKYGHHEGGSDKSQSSSSSSSSGVVRSREEQQRDCQVDVKLNEDGSGQLGNRSNLQEDTQGEMSFDDELENRSIADEDKEAKR